MILPTIRADLLLIHPPAVFDFRDRGDIYFPYLCTSGDVPITPLYEYFPLGFKTLQRALAAHGHEVRILNLASLLLRFPAVDADALLRAFDVRLFGIDLHWMVHVQGSLAVGALLKQIHPDVPLIYGGISATYYAGELICYPFIDMVMRGYDTHAPMADLLAALGDERRMETVENLLWKRRDGEVVDNGLSYTPDTFACGIDWSTMPAPRKTARLPIREVLSTQNAGCAHNCSWCGGSREAFRRLYGRPRAMARKPLTEIEHEMGSLEQLPERRRYHFYSVGSYNEPRERMLFFLDLVARADFQSVSYEQFHLTSDEVLRRMVAANKRTVITLSPESHDMRIARLAGRGVYTPEEMEDWIERALVLGIYEIDIWYFVGLPEQNARSVMETVAYCGRLLRRFRGRNVVPFICPMIPFLDPASTLFEEPERHGYRVFYRTVEEHRRGMERASLINRLNYETHWLPRADLVRTGYRAVRALTELKAEVGLCPGSVADSVCRKIDDALEWIDVVHEMDSLADAAARRRALDGIAEAIRRRNNELFFSGVANQAFPVPRDASGRWFDETPWDEPTLLAWTRP